MHEMHEMDECMRSRFSGIIGSSESTLCTHIHSFVSLKSPTHPLTQLQSKRVSSLLPHFQRRMLAAISSTFLVHFSCSFSYHFFGRADSELMKHTHTHIHESELRKTPLQNRRSRMNTQQTGWLQQPRPIGLAQCENQRATSKTTSTNRVNPTTPITALHMPSRAVRVTATLRPTAQSSTLRLGDGVRGPVRSQHMENAQPSEKIRRYGSGKKESHNSVTAPPNPTKPQKNFVNGKKAPNSEQQQRWRGAGSFVKRRDGGKV